ncbi:hypothetical protein FACS1894127_6760 [Clostridia bacterium]|nr:hypothetical protein FACS1894127_6760 [Clostridia bacterium]
MGGIIFHEKKATFSDGYKAYGNVTLPTNSIMLPSGSPTFVSYAFFGCHGNNNIGNFDAGIQVSGGAGSAARYKLFLNGGSVLAASWYETTPAFYASGTQTLTVELVYLTATTGKVVISGFGKTLSANFGTGMWQNKFQNGVQFYKELTVASSENPFTNLWSSANINKTKTVYMNDMTFGAVSVQRHSGATTSLDSNCTITTGTPKLDPQTSGSVPTWAQMRYGGTPTSGSSNYFSIDCT